MGKVKRRDFLRRIMLSYSYNVVIDYGLLIAVF